MNFFDKITDKIRHIQSEPESVKVRYIWILAIAIFILFAAAWLIFSKLTALNAGSTASAPVTDAKNNINDLKEKIKSSYSEMKNKALPEFKELLKDKKPENDNSSNTVDNNLK